jgi:hypothetical protein
MTKTTAKKTKVVAPKLPAPSQPLNVVAQQGETEGQTYARAVFSPAILSAIPAHDWLGKGWRNDVSLADTVTAMSAASKKVNANDLSDIEATLANQAVALSSIFANLSNRAKLNVAEYPQAFEMYMKLALKAQNQARMTLETLANVKNPPVVFAKQANINNGGQQQVNNTLHAPATENENRPSKILEQSIEQRMDTGTQSQTGAGNSTVEAMAELHRP